MWTPTHVQVTVQRAKGLLVKGKSGSNDAFVTISLGKEKYQTSVKERVTDPVEWHEECELAIPRHGNKAEIVLTILHRNFIGDEFLGQVTIPLSDFDVYDKPKNRWYNLKCKPGQDKTNYRGEIEVRVSFTVQSGVTAAGSLSELKKDGIRASFGQLSQKVGSSIGGSLLSLKGKGDKKGLKSLAKAVGNKVNKVSTLPGRGHKKRHDDSFGAIPEQLAYSSNTLSNHHRQPANNESDPGVISDEEDEFRFDELSHKSSHSSLSVSQVAISTPRDGSLENLGGGEFLRRNYATPPPVKPSRNHDTAPDKPERWSTGPIDDWETKLFGKQTILDKAASLKRNSKGNNGYNSDKEESEPKPDPEDDRLPVKDDSPLKPTFQSIFNTVGSAKEKEPVPKPRHTPTIAAKSGEANKISGNSTPSKDNHPKIAPKPPTSTTTSNNNSINRKSTIDETDSHAKESEKNTSTSSIFKEVPGMVTPPKNNVAEEEVPNHKWTPVGITNPIRQKESHPETRLPREIVKKFEQKSREDLIEMVIKQQATLEYQRQKLNDMEDYIDNLLVRVMENKPTLLQTPYVTHRPMKFSADTVGDWFALSE